MSTCLRCYRPVAFLFVLGCAGQGANDDTTTDTADDPGVESLVREPELCGRPEVALVTTETGFVATTAHYTLRIDGFDEAESENLAALAETAWEGFASFFGATAEGPFEAYVAADQVGFEALLAADGIFGLGGAGGYYEPGNGRAYLYRQPTAYYSRVLLLHELVHQYHDHVGGVGALPSWYVEGLAEALGRHHWDGNCLELRVRPLLSFEDAAASALAELDAGVDIAAVLAGGPTSRPIAHELVRLLSSDPELADGFAAWRNAVAGGTEATDMNAFGAAIAPVDEVAEAFAAWVPRDQEPMTPLLLDWIPQGSDSARGFSSVSSAVRLKDVSDVFSMSTDAPSAGASVGTVYGYDPATGDTELAFVSADGAVSRFAVLAGVVTWDILGSASVTGGVVWSQASGDGVTTVTIGDASIDLPRTLPAAGGLALYNADAVFEGLAWR